MQTLDLECTKLIIANLEIEFLSVLKLHVIVEIELFISLLNNLIHQTDIDCCCKVFKDLHRNPLHTSLSPYSHKFVLNDSSKFASTPQNGVSIYLLLSHSLLIYIDRYI